MNPRVHHALRLIPLLVALLPPHEAAAWGRDVHRMIHRAAVRHLPDDFGFGRWTDSLVSLSTAADERKCCDPREAIKHYIDIDDYEEFFDGSLPHDWNAVLARYGRPRVEGNGIVPWAIDSTRALLEQRFREHDWRRVVLVAADLGHYVADSHQPLHLTLNYDGQLTGQRGVHSRFESQMTSLHLQELEPPPLRAAAYVRPLDEEFAWISDVYAGVGIVLDADEAAQQAAGGDWESQAYFDVMWERTGWATRAWVRDASLAVAGMWLGAWRAAGSPVLPGEAPPSAPLAAGPRLDPNYPNPFNPSTVLLFEVSEFSPVWLRILDARGALVRDLLRGPVLVGEQRLTWDGRDDAGRAVPSGVYRVRIEQRGRVAERKAVLVR